FAQCLVTLGDEVNSQTDNDPDIDSICSKLQTGPDMYWLKQGDTSGTAGFESLAA
ncbi:hypothetical protein QTP70_025828, partial [Hemibagrus guttatus]